jgi:prefoldin alpha subunit
MASSNQQINISQLELGELRQLQQQLSSEVNNFVSSLIALQQTAAKFATAGRSVESLKDTKQGDMLMLPMTESLYVPGTLENVDTVLLEIGTGYYVERGVDAGVEYCRRKVMLVKERIEQLSRIIQSRREALGQIAMLIQQKASA